MTQEIGKVKVKSNSLPSSNTTTGAVKVGINNQNAQRVQSIQYSPGSSIDTANNAFEKANNAYDLAVVAYNTGNAAYSTANASYSTGNSAYLTANIIFAKSNTDVNNTNSYISSNVATLRGEITANAASANSVINTNISSNVSTLRGEISSNTNSVFAQANAAYATANAAFESANNVFPQISPAFSQANAAYATANASYAQANSSYGNANTKVSKSGDTMTGTLFLTAPAPGDSLTVANNTGTTLSITREGHLTVFGQANVYERLAVGTGAYTSLPNLISQFTGNSELYSQVNQQNMSANGTGDFVITTNNGTDTVNYADMGMAGNTYNNTTFNAFSFVKPNDGYFMIIGNDGQDYGGNVFYGTTGSGGSTSNVGDITFVQGSNYDEVGTFVRNQGLVLKGLTPSTSNSTGSLVVQGGIGANGAIRGDSIYDSGSRIIHVAQAAFDKANTSSGTANAYTDTANTNLKLYVDGNITANVSILRGEITANAASANSVINSRISANVATLRGEITANAVSANSVINTNISANVSTLRGEISSNVSSVFAHSNAAYGTANAGYIHANSAYDTANTKYSSSGGTIFGSVLITNDLNVSGNIIIGGNTTSLSANNLVINDSIIYLANNSTGNTLDIGLVGHFTQTNYQHTGIVRDHTDGEWKFFSNVTNEPTTTINLDANTVFDSIKVGGISTPYANISGVDILTYSTSSYSTVNTSITNTNSYISSNVSTLRGEITSNNVATFAQANAAYATANAAYESANNVFPQIAPAFAHANAAFAQGNTTITNTNSYISANVAILRGEITANAVSANSVIDTNISANVATLRGEITANANLVYAQANAAYATANAAFVVANNAYPQISLVYGAANTAYATANAAYATANAAYAQGNTTITNTNSYISSNVAILRGEITANAVSANSVINTNISANVANLQSEITANAVSANSVINTNISANVALLRGEISSNVLTLNVYSQAAYAQANTGNTTAQAAFDKANTGPSYLVTALATGSNNRITVSAPTGNVSIDLATIPTITSGTYTYPSLIVDSYGRITSITTQTPVTSISANSNSTITQTATSGEVHFDLAPSGVSAGTYGSAISIPTIVVDTYGRLTNVTANSVSTTINLAGNTGTGTVSGNGTLTLSGSNSISTSVSSGTFTITNNGILSFNTRTGVVSLTSSDVTTALGYTPANKAGDTVSGNFTGITTLGANNVTYAHSTTFSTTFTTSTTSPVTIDSFPITSYRSAKYFVQLTSSTSYHVIELSLVHNGTSVYLAQYGEVFTSASLGTFDASIVTGQLNLTFTGANAVTTVKLIRDVINI